MSYSEILNNYVTDIEHNKIQAGIYTKKAIKRFLHDLKRSKEGTFPYIYIQEEADNICGFAEMLKPADMNGKTLKLLPWQVFIMSNLEGWRHRDDPSRKRYRTAYVEVNRKNGKTTGLLLPLVLYNFLKYKSAESYIVSSRDDLSEKTFKEVGDIIHAEPALDSVLQCRSLAITFKDIEEKARLAFYCDGGKSVDGLRPVFYALDEYHEYASDKMFTSMSYGTRSKKDAQGVIITTADTDINRACYEQHLKAKRILNGLQIQEDFFSVIYALDENDDFNNPDLWIKANPSLYDVIDPSVIQSDIDDAKLTPHKLPELKAKTFGIWGGGSEKSWLPVETWQKNKDVEVDWKEFEGCECFGGLDLSQTGDMTAFSLCFRKEGKLYFRHRFYIPEDTLRDRYRKENVNIMSWVESGIVRTIPGSTIDYDFVINDILEDAELFHMLALGYDKWQAKNVIQALEEERPDIALIEVEQSMKKLSPLTYAYEKQIKDGNVVDNNPVMLWMVNNVEAYYDPNDNIKLKKKDKSSTQRIDGVIASIMAYGVMCNPAFAGERIAPMTFDELKALL